jgi:hypothetical protein
LFRAGQGQQDLRADLMAASLVDCIGDERILANRVQVDVQC